jgi:hypothetical protein
VKDEAIRVWLREDLPELLEGPRGGRVRRGIDVEQAATVDLKRHEDIEDPERRGDYDTEVAGDERLGVIPDERRPPLPTGSGQFSSTAPRAAHVPAEGPW